MPALRLRAGCRARSASPYWQIADTERSQTIDGVRQRRRRAEPFECRQRALPEVGIVAEGQGTRLFVGAAECPPGSSGWDEVARDLQRVWFGQARERNVPFAGLPQQPRHFAPVPGVPTVENRLAHGSRFIPRTRLVALQQRRFGTRGAGRPQPQQFAGAIGQRECFVERGRGFGQAAASAHLAQCGQRHHPCHRRQLRLSKQLTQLRLARVPTALPNTEDRSCRQEIPTAGIEIVLDREGDGGGQPALGLVESHGRQRCVGQIGQRPAGMIEEPLGGGELQAPFQFLVPLVVPGVGARRTDVVQGVDEGFRLPELFGKRDRPITPTERFREIEVEHAQLSEVAVGHGQLGSGSEWLQHLQRGRCRRGGGLLEPVEVREPAQILPHLPRVGDYGPSFS